ncbi:cleavage and polyadenylation specificity factor subunit 6 [Notolabrus celidotus]|uniref:cleavage and polyadenylation specificity factor subunit 6 n=1 Tax=Notolabrus celidotus TaxID=1203425 RepID=UPI0014908284|nr:cleavage and polyadenylation specificity factor subunit 6 [Notolabrus celidotus]
MHETMLWSCVILLSAALSVESYLVRDQHERLSHGRQLKIYLPKTAEKLEFSPADEPNKLFMYWERGHTRLTRGRVSGTGSDRRWYIDKVTYEDEGTYTQRDYWGKEISAVKVAVTPRHNYLKCVAGETLGISLEGLDLADSFLSFSGVAANVTLVREGARVSQDIPEYWDRVQTHSMKIEIRNVNVSDEGRYELKDRRDRLVSVTRMDLTDRHEYSEGNPLMALLLLLGIPAGICCCCRKKIFKKKTTNASTLQTSPEAIHLPPAGPAGPAPPYDSPGPAGGVYYHGPVPSMGPSMHPPPQPSGPGQWIGPPPSPGFNPAYPPQNAVYPPAGPQWNGPPPAQYPPGHCAPMGYAPVMYSSPAGVSSEPVKGELKMEAMNSSPADPLLTNTAQADPAPGAPVPPPSSTEAPPSGGGFQFQIDGGKSSTNFL